jgi:hypothetical protein
VIGRKFAKIFDININSWDKAQAFSKVFCSESGESTFLLIIDTAQITCHNTRIIKYRDLKVKVKNDIFLDVTPCYSCKNRRFGGTFRLHHPGDKNRRASFARYCYRCS